MSDALETAYGTAGPLSICWKCMVRTLPGGCAKGCFEGWPGDGICDPACNNGECGFDDGDCDTGEYCADGCPIYWIGDGICDITCFVDACDYDDGDCEDASK